MLLVGFHSCAHIQLLKLLRCCQLTIGVVMKLSSLVGTSSLPFEVEWIQSASVACMIMVIAGTSKMGEESSACPVISSIHDSK